MKYVFVAVFAVACIVGQGPASAAAAHFGAHGTGGMFRGGGGAPRMQMPNMQSRIPAPLAAPAQPPVINGPLAPSGLPPMGNAR
jgi:hypothetical protein